MDRTDLPKTVEELTKLILDCFPSTTTPFRGGSEDQVDASKRRFSRAMFHTDYLLDFNCQDDRRSFFFEEVAGLILESLKRDLQDIRPCLFNAVKALLGSAGLAIRGGTDEAQLGKAFYDLVYDDLLPIELAGFLDEHWN